jgi:pilus assembly protein FimV
MKRPLQLPLAIALALGGTNALALGLGPVHVKSKLNQPLDAEIPVIQGTAGEAEGLLVNLAAAEDFERVGVNRSHLGVPLDFALVKGSNGEMVIKVTSKEAVHDSYLDFLVEANWPKGRLLREYTVLLDPPVTAPARGAATTSAVAAAPSPVTVKKHEAPAVSTPPPPAATPRATAKATPAPAPAPAPVAPAHKANAGEYGPVAAGETLSGVAHATKVGGTNADQMMLALLKNNPNAFYKDNINALKRGAILRVPSADEIKAMGSVSEAAAQVHSQIEDWRGGRASPTRIADAGSRTSEPSPVAATTTPKTTKPVAAAPSGKAAASEHLALVPPKVGKDSVAMADRPGAGAGSPAATSELKTELARAKETLTTREQEAGELKSRVKELEDLKNKNDRLIGLKDSEIAELQQKLKQLQEKSTTATKPTPAPTPLPAASTPATTAAAAPAAATTLATATTPKTPATTTPTTPAGQAATAAKIDKQDIWGEAGSSSSTSTAGTGKPSTPSTTPSTTTTPAATTPVTTTPGGEKASSPTLPTSTPSTSAASTPVSTTTPLAETPPTTPAATPVAPKVTAPVPAKPASTVKVPAPAAAEWYEAPWVKPAALGAGVLLLLGGVLGLRKRKVATDTGARGSIANSFGQSPLKPSGDSGHAANSLEAEEAGLREQMQLDPSNVGLHLELLSLYYAERDVAKFEDAAADMHVHVEDPHQPEWLEAQAMGQELAPHNPLFSGAAHYDDSDAAFASAHADTVERPRFDNHDDFAAHTPYTPPPAAARANESTHADLGFNLGHSDFNGKAGTAANSVAKHDEGFDFTLPPLDLDSPVTHNLHETAPAAPNKAADLDDDYFPGDDAIGTKLDLAKAYMDMGDPEGARSMLEEVVAEGSDAQKAEAHRLIAEIR